MKASLVDMDDEGAQLTLPNEQKQNVPIYDVAVTNITRDGFNIAKREGSHSCEEGLQLDLGGVWRGLH